jgi:hypothetical protein
MAPSILLSDGSLVFVTQAGALFTGSVSLSMSESVDLAILYGQPMTEDKALFSVLPDPFLHFGNITDAPAGGLRWCVLSSIYEQCFFDEFVRVGGLTVSVRGDGSYLMIGERNRLSGFLVSSDDN